MSIKQNESTLDRIVRAVVGVILLYAGLGGLLIGGWAFVVDIIGAVLLITAAVGFCPLYALLGFSTHKA